jgi:hypothetical protein
MTPKVGFIIFLVAMSTPFGNVVFYFQYKRSFRFRALPVCTVVDEVRIYSPNRWYR